MHVFTLASELSWLLKWWTFNHKMTLKDSFAHCLPTEHTHISLDLFNIPCSYWTSTILPSVVVGRGGCLSIYVLLLWGVVSVQEGTAHQITSGCPHGITQASLPTHARTCINIHIPMLPPLPPSPKRWHTAVIAQNKMSCQSRKITQ